MPSPLAPSNGGVARKGLDEEPRMERLAGGDKPEPETPNCVGGGKSDEEEVFSGEGEEPPKSKCAPAANTEANWFGSAAPFCIACSICCCMSSC